MSGALFGEDHVALFDDEFRSLDEDIARAVVVDPDLRGEEIAFDEHWEFGLAFDAEFVVVKLAAVDGLEGLHAGGVEFVDALRGEIAGAAETIAVQVKGVFAEHAFRGNGVEDKTMAGSLVAVVEHVFCADL